MKYKFEPIDLRFTALYRNYPNNYLITVAEDYTITLELIDGSTITITIPKGFATDLATVPEYLPAAYTLIKLTTVHAGVIHDYLYGSGVVPRKDADHILKQLCESLAVPEVVDESMYEAVRVFGASHYSVSKD